MTWCCALTAVMEEELRLLSLKRLLETITFRLLQELNRQKNIFLLLLRKEQLQVIIQMV